MSTMAKLTTIGLYEWDDTLFDSMVLPPSIDKDKFVNVFLMEHGEAPVLFPDWDYMKFYLTSWAAKWYDSIERIVAVMNDDYNPLDNYNRHEEYEDTEKTDTDYKNNGTIENTVSAYNVNTYQPDTKQLNNNSGDSGVDRNLKHNAHLWGNIGVTTSQQMLKEEMRIRENTNIYSVISDMLYNEVCYYIY